jgi:integrase
MQKKCGLLDDQIQANLGHTDARTTQGYLHEIDKSRFHAMQKMRLIVK